MIAREPNLLETVDGIHPLVRDGSRPAPRNTNKIGPIFIDRHRVPSEPNVLWKMKVVAFWKQARQSDRRNSFPDPDEIGQGADISSGLTRVSFYERPGSRRTPFRGASSQAHQIKDTRRRARNLAEAIGIEPQPLRG